MGGYKHNSSFWVNRAGRDASPCFLLPNTRLPLPRKALRNPRKSHFALQGVQSLHRTNKGPQIGLFQLSAHFGHLRLAHKMRDFTVFSCFFVYFTYLCRRNAK